MTTPIVPSITDEQLAELESSADHQYCTVPGSIIAGILLRLRAAEKDAARYRWLRDKGLRNELFAASPTIAPGLGPYIAIQLPTSGAPNLVALGSGADAHVDVAMEKNP